MQIDAVPRTLLALLLATSLNAFAADAPKEWKDDQFARVWDFTFDEKGKVTFKDRPQHLMAGDAKK